MSKGQRSIYLLVICILSNTKGCKKPKTQRKKSIYTHHLLWWYEAVMKQNQLANFIISFYMLSYKLTSTSKWNPFTVFCIKQHQHYSLMAHTGRVMSRNLPIASSSRSCDKSLVCLTICKENLGVSADGYSREKTFNSELSKSQEGVQNTWERSERNVSDKVGVAIFSFVFW